MFVASNAVIYVFSSYIRFKEGLGSLGLLQELETHPKEFETIFLEDSTSLQASDIVQLFKTRCSSMSLPGSNKRRLETRSIGFWRDWLLEVQGICFSGNKCLMFK